MLLSTAFVMHLLASVAMAVPVERERGTNVIVCTDTDYAGACTVHATPLGNNNCNSIDGDSVNARSIKLDQGLDCIFYSNGVCRTLLDPATESLSVRSPGNADLSANSRWTGPVLSYTCVGVAR